jgi:hypothetical protein
LISEINSVSGLNVKRFLMCAKMRFFDKSQFLRGLRQAGKFK